MGGAKKSTAMPLGLGIMGSLVSGGSPWGYMAGYAIGSWLFPPEEMEGIDPPDPYRTLGVNTSGTGNPWPLLYGTNRFGGNYIWKGALTHSPIYEKSDTGGKGGGGGGGSKKQVVGHKYYMDAMIGCCQGEADLGRMFFDNAVYPWRDDTSISFYRGTSSQTAWSVYSAEVSNPTTFRNLSYIGLDDFYIGENTSRAPIVTTELHRYPYNVAAGTSARIYTHYSELASAGLCAKRDNGTILSVDEDNLVIYGRDWSQKTIYDVSDVFACTYSNGAYSPVRGIDLIETEKEVYMNVAWYENRVMERRAHVAQIKINKHYDSLTITKDDITDTTIVDEPHGSDAPYAIDISHNDNKSYAVWRDLEGDIYLEEYDYNDYTVTPTQYDISTYFHTSNYSDRYIRLVTTNNTAYVIAQENTNYGYELCSFDIDNSMAFVASDTIAQSEVGGKPGIAVMHGENELIAIGTATSGSTREMILFEIDTDGNITRKTNTEIQHDSDIDMTDRFSNYLTTASDGTLFINWNNNGAPAPGIPDWFLGAEQYIIDANPAQVLYDVIVNEAEYSTGDIASASLQEMSTYCMTNTIGISPVFNTKRHANDIIRQIMNDVMGLAYIDNEGQFAVKVFQNSDSSEGTITAADIVEGSFEHVNIELKDKRECANRININYLDRMNKYKKSDFTIDHFVAQEEDGEIISETWNMQDFSNVKTASKIAWQYLKSAQYDTHVFTFDLMPQYMGLNIGAVLTLNIASENLVSQKVRVLQIGDPDLRTGATSITARREETWLNTFDDYVAQANESDDTQEDLPKSVIPVIFELPAVQTDDSYYAGITAITNDENTVACGIHLSDDNISFTKIGECWRLAYTGDIGSAVDSGDKRISIDITDYPDAFATYTVTDQRNDETFSLIGELQTGDCELSNMEFVTYRESSTSGNTVTLKNCYRGKYYTLPKDHTTDEVLLHVGTNRFFLFSFPGIKVGKTVYVKVTGMNYAGVEEDTADVDSYEYTVIGLTKKATHVSGLQIYDPDNSIYKASLDTIASSDVTVKWKETARLGGWSSKAFITGWEWNDFYTGDVNDYNILIYDSSLNHIATHNLGNVLTEYEYTKSQNETDFGSLTKDFYIGVQPLNDNGGLPNDIVKQHVELNI